MSGQNKTEDGRLVATPQPFLLTEDEHAAIRMAGDLAGLLGKIAGDGPTRHADLTELVASIHAIQHAVMAQAAARSYPETYRLLGESLTVIP